MYSCFGYRPTVDRWTIFIDGIYDNRDSPHVGFPIDTYRWIIEGVSITEPAFLYMLWPFVELLWMLSMVFEVQKTPG